MPPPHHVAGCLPLYRRPALTAPRRTAHNVARVVRALLRRRLRRRLSKPGWECLLARACYFVPSKGANGAMLPRRTRLRGSMPTRNMLSTPPYPHTRSGHGSGIPFWMRNDRHPPLPRDSRHGRKGDTSGYPAGRTSAVLAELTLRGSGRGHGQPSGCAEEGSVRIEALARSFGSSHRETSVDGRDVGTERTSLPA